MANTDKVTKFMNMLKGNEPLAYDVETGGPVPGDGAPLDWKRGYVCGYSLSDGVDSVYVPVRHDSNNIDMVDTFEHDMAKAIRSRTEPLIGHNIKFDAHFSYNHGILLGDKVVDTMVDAALLNENKFSYNLENCCKEYDIPQKKGKELKEHIANRFNFKSTKDAMGHYYRLPGDDPLAVDYAETDTLATYHLNDVQTDKLNEENLETVSNLERELSFTLFKMERRGVTLDLEELKRVEATVEKLWYEAHLKIPIGEDFMPINTRSGKDLQKYFEQCEIFDWPVTDPTERFPNGQPSFNKNFLKSTEEGRVIQDARRYSTFKSMFMEPFPRFVFNGKIHARFNQAVGEFGGARPGRLSCGDPNMQFVPKRDKFLGRIFRKAFIPSDAVKYLLVELDYSQAEPRLFTHYSGEPTLMKGYSSTPAIDMHSIAAEYMHIYQQYPDTDDGRDSARGYAKNLNLGMMYVMGGPTLSGHLNISLEDARAISRLWHRTFPNVSSFTRLAAKRAEERKYVFTVLGRRARFSDPRYCYRAANRIVQGGSADILKWKMVEIEKRVVADGLQDEIRMLLTIHDALLFEVARDRAQEHIEYIKGIMEDVQAAPFNLRVPFRADYKYGDNWAEATYGKAA